MSRGIDVFYNANIVMTYRDRERENKKKYYQLNREKFSERSKKRNRENKEVLKIYKKEWYQRNKERLSLKHKEYNLSHRKELNEYRKNQLERLKMDDYSKYLQMRLSRHMRAVISRKVKYKTKHTFDALNYTVDDLINYLESKFKNGMMWTNYGKVWEIDHLIPQSWFNYSSIDDYEFRQCWRLENLQPEFIKKNRKKHNNFADNNGQLEILI